MSLEGKRESEVWTIGGGKGGTGKSFLISALGTCLASKGRRVILIDADLGGANLHTLFGVHRPKFTLTDFFEGNRDLLDLVVETRVPNLGIVPGAIRTLAPDGIKHTQKLKFFRHIRALESRYVLVDLGAGTHVNTLDAFLLADKMILTLVPQITAIENAYFFLKSAFFRRLMNALAAHGLKDLLKHTWSNRGEHGISNLGELLDYLRSLSNPIERIVDREVAAFNVYIAVNQIRSIHEIQIGNAVKSVCRKYFGFHAQFVGYVEYDDIVSKSVNKGEPFMQIYPSSRCAREIERVTENLTVGKQIKTGL
jgi:flagellar biosynthesis protein FlhG